MLRSVTVNKIIFTIMLHDETNQNIVTKASTVCAEIVIFGSNDNQNVSL